MISIVLIFFLVFNFLFELINELNLFQQSSYKYNKYLLLIKRRYLLATNSFLKLLVVLFTIIYLFTNSLLIGFFVLFIILGNYMLSDKKILKLKFTKRIIRLIITIIILTSFLSFWNIYLLSIITYIIPFIIILSNWINGPLEVIINKYFISKAKQKIERLNILKIGITGSQGKTSVKSYLQQVLSNKYIVHKSPKSFNTLLGITKDIINNLEEYNEMYILELAATRPKDILKINQLVNVDIGVITSIGTQHLDSFKDINTILKTKMEILLSKNIKSLFINADSLLLDTFEYPENINVIRIGMNNQNVDYLISHVKEEFNKLSFQLNNKVIEVNLLGIHNVFNIALVYAICKELEMNELEIAEYIKRIKPVEHRLEYIENNTYSVIDDSFNANFEGFLSALNALDLSNNYKILITPGIVDQDIMLDEYYQVIAKKISAIVDYTYLVKNKYISILTNYLKEFKYYKYTLVDSFNEAVRLINEKEYGKKYTILIENDLTDYYLNRR